MSEESEIGLYEELQRLRQDNADLHRKVLALANANAYAAELLAALEEAQEREAKLVRRGEELDLQTRLDLVMQGELIESRLIERVAQELVSTRNLGARDYKIAFPSESPVAEACESEGTFSIPICVSEKIVGQIRLKVGETDSKWAERWVRFLCSIGNQLGMSLQRLRVERENERMNTELIVARDQALEASRAKTVFLATMSHELRTPMNAILGYSEMLIEDASVMSAEEIMSDLHKIRDAGKHLLALINDILDLSKIESGKMTIHQESFDVTELIEEVVSAMKPIAAKNGNSIESRYPADFGTMHSDSMKVRQSLMNLVSNACKFSMQSTIEVALSTRSHEGQEYVLFAVSDHGIGMSTEQISKLFEAFVQADDSTTRKYGGTGLGLTISRRLCQMLGGDIVVRSELGSGATFTMELPRMYYSDSA